MVINEGGGNLQRYGTRGILPLVQYSAKRIPNFRKCKDLD